MKRTSAPARRESRESHPPGKGRPVLGASVVLALLAIELAPPESRAFVTRLAILSIGLVAARRVLRQAAAVTVSSPEHFDDALRQPPVKPFEIPGLWAVETDVRMATTNAFGVELRLKPVLRELARWRLLHNHGINLDREPDRARQVLGEPLWRMVASSDAFPEFRAPGISLAEVQAGIDKLERI